MPDDLPNPNNPNPTPNPPNIPNHPNIPLPISFTQNTKYSEKNDPPLVAVSVTNPVTYLKLFLKRFLKIDLTDNINKQVMVKGNMTPENNVIEVKEVISFDKPTSVIYAPIQTPVTTSDQPSR